MTSKSIQTIYQQTERNTKEIKLNDLIEIYDYINDFINVIKEELELKEDELNEFNKIFNKSNNLSYWVYIFNNIKYYYNLNDFNEVLLNYIDNDFNDVHNDLIKQIEEFKEDNKEAGLILEMNEHYKYFNPLELSETVPVSVCALDLNDVDLNEETKLKTYSLIIGLLNQLTTNEEPLKACLSLWYSDNVLYIDLSLIQELKQNEELNKEAFKTNNDYFNQLDSGLLMFDDNEKYKIKFVSFNEF